MQDIKEYYIPKHLDSPPKIIFWTADEFTMFFAPVMLGLFLDKFFISAVVGVFLYNKWRQIKGIGKGNVPLFFIYWFLPKYFIGFKKTPHSSNTVFI